VLPVAGSQVASAIQPWILSILERIIVDAFAGAPIRINPDEWARATS
jgi:hypothetical protein